MKYGIALAVTLALAAGAVAEMEAPLVVREHTGVARVGAPVAGGVPVGPFSVKKADELGLFDATGKPVPSQIVPTVTAPGGTLSWVLVDFKTGLKPNEVKRFTLRRVAGAKAKVGVRVEQRADSLVIDTGILKAVVGTKRFDLFEHVWFDRNGDGKYTKDEALLAPADKRAPSLVLVDAVSKKTYTSRDGVVQKVVQEHSGLMRTTIRVDGAFGSSTANEPTYLQYTARLTFWAGSPNVKLIYAIRNTKTGTAAKVRRATVTLNLAENKRVREYIVGAGRPHVSRLYGGGVKAAKTSQRHWAVRLEQRGPDQPILSRTHRATFHMGTEFDEMGYRVIQEQPGPPTKRRRYVDCGMHCGGWIDLADETGGCLVWLRNFTQNPLKRLRADAHGRIDLDLIPEYDGNRQMFYAGGGFWLTQGAHRTYEIGFGFHGKPYTNEDDWMRWQDTFNVYDPASAETQQKVGVAVRFFEHPLVMTAEPGWYTKARTMCGPVPSVADEARVNKMWGRTKEGPFRPHRQEKLGVEFLPRENYHWRSEADEPRDCLLTYIRTGDYHFLKRARSFANVARDMGVFRRDTGLPAGKAPKLAPQSGREKSMTGTGWGSTKMCGCHNYGAGLIDMWLTTGDRSYRDASVDNTEGHVGGRLHSLDRGASRIGAGAIRVQEVTHDPRYRNWIKAGAVFPAPDEGLRQQGLGVMPGEVVGSWMHAIGIYSRHRNVTLNADVMDPLVLDQTRDRIIAWARVGASHGRPATKPKTKKGYGLCAIYTIMAGYDLTGDKTILDGAKRIWDRMHKLGDDTVDARLRDWGPSSGANLYWARYLFDAYANPRKDGKPPVAINDLKAEALGGGKVKLTWTAPRDDGGGTVAEYQLKHAPLPIVTWDAFHDTYPNDVGKKYSWFGGYNVAGEPKPTKPGTQQSMTVTVPAGTRYFRLRARDDSKNQGPLSNEAVVEVK